MSKASECERSEQAARVFYELYRAHRDVLADALKLDDFGFRNPAVYEDISDLNEAALVLTFDAILTFFEEDK